MMPRMCLTERGGLPHAIRIDGDMEAFIRCLEASERQRADEALAEKLADMDELWSEADPMEDMRDRILELERDGDVAIAEANRRREDAEGRFALAACIAGLGWLLAVLLAAGMAWGGWW